MTDAVRSRIGLFEFTIALVFAALPFVPEANAACGNISGQPVRQVFSNGSALATCLDGDNWTNIAGSGTPAGSTGYVQFNNAGAFAGDSGLFWDNTNKRLGIGTTTPMQNFELRSGNMLISAPEVSGSLVFVPEDQSAAYSNTANEKRFQLMTTGMSDGTIGYKFSWRNADGSERVSPLYFHKNGNIGIGAETPAGKLAVVAGGNALPATSGTTQSVGLIARLRDSSNLTLDVGGYGSSGAWLQATNQTNLATNYPLLLNPNGGNVGIGTTSPTSRLDVYQGNLRVRRDSDQYMEFQNNDASGGFIRGRSRENNKKPLYIETLHDSTGSAAGNMPIIFRSGPSTGPTELMRITDDGNVGIGTLTPSRPLTVTAAAGSGGTVYIARDLQGNDGGQLEISNGNGTGLMLGSTGSGANDPSVIKTHTSEDLYFQIGQAANSASPDVVFKADGNVGIGTTNPIYKLDVGGTLRATQLRFTDATAGGSTLCYGTGSGTYIPMICSSLRNLKRNISDISMGLETVMDLRPVEYDWIPESGGHHDLGFIAEEVEEINPTLAVYNDGKLQSVNYAHLTALLARAIQELKVENDELRAVNDNHAAALDALRAEIDTFKSSLGR